MNAGLPSLFEEKITSVHHWNETLFSFKATRDPALRFKNGEFLMIGLEVDGKPLLRAYSIASANYADELEFFSIKVADGPLTSRLQSMKVGDRLLVSNKPTGTLVLDHLLPGKNLFLISTGTGLAPFISIIQDPATYEVYEKVILTHGVRYVSELAYRDFINNQLINNEYFGDVVRKKLLYYPTVTRETFSNTGRVTDKIKTAELTETLGLEKVSESTNRFMICGSPSMLKDTCEILDDMGFTQSEKKGEQAQYVIERAFVEQ